MGKHRILVSAFGSAGDLFPLLPALALLKSSGHEVTVATSRAAGLYLRAAGLRTLALGDGSELRVIDDPKMASSRFDGWSSWRHCVNAYVAPDLSTDVAKMETLIDDWAPDLLVAGSFAGAGRIAAINKGLRVLDVSLYPQHQQIVNADTGFARSYLRAARAAIRPDRVDKVPASKWLWGVTPDVLLHDRLLLGESYSELSPVGFPSWNQLPTNPGDESTAERFLCTDSPTVLATFGSFMGLSQFDAWLAVADAAKALGVRALLVGVGSRWAAEVFGGRNDVVAVGLLQLDRHLPNTDVVLHHGGIGTAMATIRAGKPSLVLPQAFDNMFNSRLLTEAGLGLATSTGALTGDLERILTDKRIASRAEAIAQHVVPPDQAAAALAERILFSASHGTEQ